MDQTIQTENANSRFGIDIHRLRFAIFLPDRAQKSASSGRQSLITGPLLDSDTAFFMVIASWGIMLSGSIAC